MHIPPRLVFIALAAVVSMSLVPVLVKSISINEVTIGLGRLSIALLCITPFVWFKAGLATLNRRQWIGLMWIGGCFGLHWLSYFYSIKLAGAAVGAIAVSTYGIHLLILNAIIKRQAIAATELLTIALCFIGCLMVAPSFDLSKQITIGMLAGVFSAVLYAAMPLLHQRVAEVPTLSRTWGQFFFAALFFLPFASSSQWDMSQSDWYKLAALGLVCTVVAHSLWVKASTELPSIVTAVVYYLYVPLAMIMSGVFLKEDIDGPMMAGAALIIVANISQAFMSWRKTKASKATA